MSMSCLCYFAIFIHGPVLKGLNELDIISHKGETATVVRCIGFHPTKTIMNCYADKLLFSNCLRIAVLYTLNTLMNNETGGPVLYGFDNTDRKQE